MTLQADADGASLRLRRVDWRFLLPDPALGPTRVVGTCDAELAAALAEVGAPRSPAGEARTLVVTDADAGVAAEAVASLQPGGQALLELRVPRTARALRHLSRTRMLLTRAGLDVRTYWALPSATAAKVFAPLDDRRLLERATARKLDPRTAKAYGRCLRTAARTGFLEPFVRSAVVVATRADGLPGPAPAPVHAAGLDAAAQVLLLSPRYDASRYAVAVAFVAGAPTSVVKISRLSEDDDALRREFRMLDSLAEHEVAGTPTSPRLVEVSGHPALVQSALPGRGLNPRTVRADHDRLVPAVTAWLAALPATGTTDRIWYDREIREPLLEVARRWPERRTDVERTLPLVEPLRDAALPAVVEHGDLREGNLLWDGNRVGIVDWESGSTDGLVAADLVFFCAYAADCRARADGIADSLAAFDRAFLGTDAWARASVTDELARRGVTVDLLPAVVIASLARYAARFAARRAPARWPACPETALWPHSVGRAESLRATR